MPITPILTGFASGAGLIIAIGSQNAYLLRQGLRREHVLPLVLICAISDALLIVLGALGVGALVSAAPWALQVLRWAGAAFLVGYGLLAARRALRPQALLPGEQPRTRLGVAALTMLALTWLNPHVYLDTVLLLGSLGAAHGDPGRWLFAAGAAAASLAWFALLGFGARALGRFFARPGAWRVLDGLIAVTMLALAVLLLVRG
ncbi:LysE/ArgO family amino acid transporter [Arenivirga flava]|uniref:Amino acid transporter n=1 Tax=Arenivirga flava TaxID=1930060 RepID=A0AA37UI25_9MICO|nr:LysE/ArgO family amino acid transporter [Arenivirga flava]GMA29359.1 amino acid transporter [Arenivirga flava]